MLLRKHAKLGRPAGAFLAPAKARLLERVFKQAKTPREQLLLLRAAIAVNPHCIKLPFVAAWIADNLRIILEEQP